MTIATTQSPEEKLLAYLKRGRDNNDGRILTRDQNKTLLIYLENIVKEAEEHRIENIRLKATIEELNKRLV